MAFINTVGIGTNRDIFNGGPFKLVQTQSGALYAFTVGPATKNLTTKSCLYYKSTDYGRTWTQGLIDSVNTHSWVSVWYDRWSGISGDLIHITFTDTSSDDVFYRSLDTSTDTLGTERLVFNGATAASTAGMTGSITVARGGNIYIYFDIDGGTEVGFYRSTDGGVNWSSRAALAEEPLDQVILMPGYAADNQDIMAFFWDVSADEISRKIYDDSADTWSETSISTGMVKGAENTFQAPWSAAPDLANSRNIIVAWNAVNAANADLNAWAVTESSITSLTDVVLNGVDDQCCAAVTITPNSLIVYYAGNSTTQEGIGAATTLNYKQSFDSGSTWTAERQYLPLQDYRGVFAPAITYAGMPLTAYTSVTTQPIMCAVTDLSPGTNGQIGMN